jgi:hypothetical protein
LWEGGPDCGELPFVPFEHLYFLTFPFPPPKKQQQQKRNRWVKVGQMFSFKLTSTKEVLFRVSDLIFVVHSLFGRTNLQTLEARDTNLTSLVPSPRMFVIKCQTTPHTGLMRLESSASKLGGTKLPILLFSFSSNIFSSISPR